MAVAGEVARSPRTTSMSDPIRVLCVEDNQLVAEAIERKLSGDPRFESAGWVNTQPALTERLASSQVDVVCMDLDMPGQDTLEMIRFIRAEHPECRVLVLTGRLGASYVDAAVAAGANGYLSKADESRVILDSIARVRAGEFVLGRYAQTDYRGTTPPPAAAPPEQAPRRSRWNPFAAFRRSKPGS